MTAISAALAVLRQLWHKAQSGTRQLALIAGEPGIGKTRLAEELATIAHDDGGLVLFGRCDDDAVVPLQPFVELLRTLTAGNTVRPDQLPVSLVRLLPELDSVRDVDNNAGTDPANQYQGTLRPVTSHDASLVLVRAGLGKVAAFFDRNTFFNPNGVGTDITQFDNRQLAILA